MLDKSLLQLNKISQRTNLIYSKSKHKTMHHRKKKKEKKKKTQKKKNKKKKKTQTGFGVFLYTDTKATVFR